MPRLTLGVCLLALAAAAVHGRVLNEDGDAGASRALLQYTATSGTCATYNCLSNPSGTSLNAAGSGPGYYCGTCTVFVYRTQTLTAATVGLPGTTRSGGRTMLWLADPSGNYVASNWYYQNTYNSYLTWTATSSGTYTIYEGEPAFSQQSSINNAAGFTSVQATVGWTLTALPMPPPTLPPPPQIQYNQCPQFSYQLVSPGQQSPPYITNMNNGVVFANCNFNANAGQVVQFGAAQMSGAQYSGPVVLWLRNSAGTVIMTGSGTGTPMTYTIPTSGLYSIWEGCSDWRSSCSATVAWAFINTVTTTAPSTTTASTNPYQAMSGTCQSASSGGFAYQACFNANANSVTVTQGGTSIGTGTYNAATGSYALGGGASCGSPSTPRAGSLRLSCGSGSTTSATVSESTLYTSGGSVACSNCCNYNVNMATPGACTTPTVTPTASPPPSPSPPPPPSPSPPPPPTVTSTPTPTSTTSSGSMSGPGTCPPYSTSNRGTARCSVYVTAGSTFTLGTTGVNGAACSGDTLITLLSPTGSTLVSNDDYGGTMCSKITYQVPSSGTYTIVEGCYSTGSCSGTVAYSR